MIMRLVPMGLLACVIAFGGPLRLPPAAAAGEQSPPGDIPDTQQLVMYRSTVGHYLLRVPEGWARRERGSSVLFTNKLLAVSVDLEPTSSPRTVEITRRLDEPKLRAATQAFQLIFVKPVTLPGGPAILVRYRADSQPAEVTGRVVRLEVDRYEIYGRGRLALLSLSAPAGADNADAWQLIARSFRWSQ
jgi:hypothetical protein